MNSNELGREVHKATRIPGIPIVPVTAYSRTVVTNWVSHRPSPYVLVLLRAKQRRGWRQGWAQKLYWWRTR